MNMELDTLYVTLAVMGRRGCFCVRFFVWVRLTGLVYFGWLGIGYSLFCWMYLVLELVGFVQTHLVLLLGIHPVQNS